MVLIYVTLTDSIMVINFLLLEEKMVIISLYVTNKFTTLVSRSVTVKHIVVLSLSHQSALPALHGEEAEHVAVGDDQEAVQEGGPEIVAVCAGHWCDSGAGPQGGYIHTTVTGCLSVCLTGAFSGHFP